MRRPCDHFIKKAPEAFNECLRHLESPTKSCVAGRGSMKSSPPPRRRNLRTRLFVFSVVAFAIVLYGEDFTCILGTPFRRADDPPPQQQEQGGAPRGTDEAVVPFAVGKTEEGCDVFAGMSVRRAIEAALPRGGLPLHPAPADMPGARPARRRLPALEMAAASLLFTQVRRRLNAGKASRQADDVRGRFLEPGPIRIHGVPPASGHPGARQIHGILRLAHGLHGQGLQCDDRVLLGAVSGGVQLRRRRRPQDQRADRPTGVHHEARSPLEGSRHRRLQHVPLVDGRPQNEDSARAPRR
ncbi:leaf senescence related protein [Musa troglodytarum]|uniref:Leaf senescence related protein n=1 Tax=Musa troglodytarum TaxID=320322 RepID=A0A9E7JIJ2_9LILI|nr:leaf senescence related protein [Musa troglodytarum]